MGLACPSPRDVRAHGREPRRPERRRARRVSSVSPERRNRGGRGAPACDRRVVRGTHPPRPVPSVDARASRGAGNPHRGPGHAAVLHDWPRERRAADRDRPHQHMGAGGLVSRARRDAVRPRALAEARAPRAPHRDCCGQPPPPEAAAAPSERRWRAGRRGNPPVAPQRRGRSHPRRSDSRRGRVDRPIYPGPTRAGRLAVHRAAVLGRHERSPGGRVPSRDGEPAGRARRRRGGGWR